VKISLDSDETQEQIRDLIRLARQMCFTEKALIGRTPLEVKQILNGQEIA